MLVNAQLIVTIIFRRASHCYLLLLIAYVYPCTQTDGYGPSGPLALGHASAEVGRCDRRSRPRQRPLAHGKARTRRASCTRSGPGSKRLRRRPLLLVFILRAHNKHATVRLSASSA